MRTMLLFAAALAASAPASANNWEKFYTPIAQEGDYPESSTPPEQIQSSGNLEADLEAMFRKGFAPIGYSHFNSPNVKTKDALRLAKKLKAKHLIIITDLTSSSTVNVPLTTPSSSTAYTSGTASAYGSGGYASGTYSGTTTTYGTSTSWIPVAVNRFDKFAAYFAEVPKEGLGVQSRNLDDSEVARLETRRALAVQYVRDGSPLIKRISCLEILS